MINPLCLLVLARPDDLHADAVIDLTESAGIKCVRMDPETALVTSNSLTAYFDDASHSAQIQIGNELITANDIGAIYCRNWNFPKAEEGAPIETHLQFHEARTAMLGFFSLLKHKYWLNPPWIEDFVDNKIFQASSARALGLRIPKTLVTNDPARARAFWRAMKGKIIIKQLSAVSLIDDSSSSGPSKDSTQDIFGFYTSEVTADSLEYFDEIRHAPCLLQEKIEKKVDVRVTVVGNKLFAHSIDSQKLSESRIDFRRSLNLISQPIVVPDLVSQNLKLMLQNWGIGFASCDFALTPEDEFVFFEANVTGNWLWLETADAHPILDSVVDELAQRCRL